MTEEQKQAVLDRDFNAHARPRRQHLLPVQDLRHRRPALPAGGQHDDRHDAVEEYQAMMLAGGRSPDGWRSIKGGQLTWPGSPPGSRTSHVPAIGAALDLGKTDEPYWQPVFAGYEWTKEWIAAGDARRRHPGLQRPRLGLLAGDDPDLRASAAPTSSSPPTRATGPRPVPVVEGHADLAWHIAQSLILDEFDLTHRQQDGRRPRPDRAAVAGLRPAGRMAGQGHPARGQRRPVPAADRPPLLRPGRGDPPGGRELPGGPQRAGLGHRRHEPPAPGRRAPGSSTRSSTTRFLDRLSPTPRRCAAIPHIEYLREAGSEGIELVMWLIMRGALGEAVEELHRFYHVPASNTAVGHLVLEPTACSPAAEADPCASPSPEPARSASSTSTA